MKRYEDRIKKQFIFYMFISLIMISIGFLFYEVISEQYFNSNKINESFKSLETHLTQSMNTYQDSVNQLVELDLDTQTNGSNVSIYQVYYQLMSRTSINGTMMIYQEDSLVFTSNQALSHLRSTHEVSQRLLTQIPESTLIQTYPAYLYDQVTFKNYLVIGSKYKSQDHLYTILFYLNPEDLNALLQSRSVDQIVLIDRFDNVIATTNLDLQNSLRKFTPKSPNLPIIERLDYQINTHYEPSSQITVVTLTSHHNTVFKYQLFLLANIVFLVVGYLIISRLSKRISRDNVASINLLVEMIDSIKEGHLVLEQSIDTNDEFQFLGEQIQIMAQTLDLLIKDNNQLIDLNMQAKIKQLESQFNPHFLFNTLENIRFMILTEPKEASLMILNLTKLLRYSSDKKAKDVSIKEDMMMIQDYLSIIKCRFEQRFTYQLNIESQSLDCIIPKLLFQPLIENSVKYGMIHQQNLHIIITVTATDHLEIVVEDNGGGMPQLLINRLERDLKHQSQSVHQGLYLVKKRIELLYGLSSSLSLVNTNDGLKVTIMIPIRRDHV